AAASTTAARVDAESSPRPLSAREAVDAETPADAATSARVAPRRLPCSVVNRLRKRLLTVTYSNSGCQAIAQPPRRGSGSPGSAAPAAHERLRAAAREGLVVQVGYQRRFDAEFVEARGLVEEGAIGEPLLVLATSRDTEWPEGELPQDTGGFLLDMAVHDYDV